MQYNVKEYAENEIHDMLDKRFDSTVDAILSKYKKYDNKKLTRNEKIVIHMFMIDQIYSVTTITGCGYLNILEVRG